jgi:hypothetical protein
MLGCGKQESDIVKGSTPSETEKETVDIAGAGNVEAPAPTIRERKLGMMVRTWTDWNPIRKPLGTSCLRRERI